MPVFVTNWPGQMNDKSGRIFGGSISGGKITNYGTGDIDMYGQQAGGNVDEWAEAQGFFNTSEPRHRTTPIPHDVAMPRLKPTHHGGKLVKNISTQDHPTLGNDGEELVDVAGNTPDRKISPDVKPQLDPAKENLTQAASDLNEIGNKKEEAAQEDPILAALQAQPEEFAKALEATGLAMANTGEDASGIAASVGKELQVNIGLTWNNEHKVVLDQSDIAEVKQQMQTQLEEVVKSNGLMGAKKATPPKVE